MGSILFAIMNFYSTFNEYGNVEEIINLTNNKRTQTSSKGYHKFIYKIIHII